MNEKNENRMKCFDLKAGMIRQIPVYDSSYDEYRRLIAFMKEKGYEICLNPNSLIYDRTNLLQIKGSRHHGPDHIEDDANIVALTIDNQTRQIFNTNITCMACWCDGIRFPLNVREFIDSYHWLIEEPGIERYHDWIERKCQEKPSRKQNRLRPIGSLIQSN